jgi:cation transport regulator ChaC
MAMSNSALHFIFAYGSLICPKSRAITAPSVAAKPATPVLVKNVERTWAKKASMSSMTAMGVQFKDDAECVGVLLPVNDSELGAFDMREQGYDRGMFPISTFRASFYTVLP